MMETNKKHTENALKQALQRRQPGRLPSNFNYRMMEQIRLEAEKAPCFICFPAWISHLPAR